MNRMAIALCAGCLAALSTANAVGQTFGPEFAGTYSYVELGSPAGVPTRYGGLYFLDSDTLLLGGNANVATGAIYAVDLVRDPVTQHVTGFDGTASLWSTAPEIDGGLQVHNGVVYYTGYRENLLGQILLGNTAPDKIIDLDGSGVANSVGSLQFVPPGFAGAGQLKLISYNSSRWYTAELTPDGMGTFDVTAVSNHIQLSGGPEGVVYIDEINEGFDVDSILVSAWGVGEIHAYEIDSRGDPIPSTKRLFLDNLPGAEGAAIDPVTGDFFFSTFGGDNQVVYVTGFIPVPEPATATLALIGMAGLTMRRRRQLPVAF